MANALALMDSYRISGIPVVERNSGRLAGILTNRDVRFAEDDKQPVSELMTRDNLITVREGVGGEEAPGSQPLRRPSIRLAMGARCV